MDAIRKAVDLLFSRRTREVEPVEIYDDIITRYAEVGRFYHTSDHILALLEMAKDLKFQDEKAVIAAILYQNIVYDVRRYGMAYEGASNEILSADYAVKNLKAALYPREFIDRVDNLICDTETHHVKDGDRDAALFMDMDTSILGAPADVYADYAQSFAAEFLLAFSAEEFTRRRGQFLTAQLKKDRIFLTPEFAHLEAQARKNIRYELDNLPAVVRQGLEIVRRLAGIGWSPDTPALA